VEHECRQWLSTARLQLVCFFAGVQHTTMAVHYKSIFGRLWGVSEEGAVLHLMSAEAWRDLQRVSAGTSVAARHHCEDLVQLGIVILCSLF
jgi:hypothetical protein